MSDELMKLTQLDLNSIFSLTYNFEKLKETLGTLIDNQVQAERKIIQLEGKFNEKDAQIMRLNKNIDQKISLLNTKSLEDLKKESEMFSQLNNGTSDENSHQTIEKIDRLNEKLLILDRRLTYIEDSYNSDKNSTKSSISEIFSILDKNNLKFNELSKMDKENSERIDELNLKLQDFNVFDLLLNKKETNQEGTEKGSDEILFLIQNVEKKILKKIGMIDEKINRLDEESYKNKNEVTNLTITSNNNEKSTNSELIKLKDSVSQMEKNQTDSIEPTIDKINKSLNENFIKFNDEISKIKRDFLDLSTDITLIKSNKTDEPVISNGLNDTENKSIKELNKKFFELDKTMKIFATNFNHEKYETDFNKVYNLINSKATKEEFKELNSSIQNLVDQIDNLRNNINDLSDEKKFNSDEFAYLRKKIEYFNTQIHPKSKEENLNTSKGLNSLAELNKYLEISLFSEFKQFTLNEFEKIKNKWNDLKRLFDDHTEIIKGKIGENELNSLENQLLIRLEELKINSLKRFPDKNDYNKNLKYIETQIKNMFEIINKRGEKSENWLIAKKPFDGYSCASCENYIGSLPEHNEFVPWNRYPLRDNVEKNYRVGNGFSRMLQTMNFEKGKVEKTISPDNLNFPDKVDLEINNYYNSDRRNNQNKSIIKEGVNSLQILHTNIEEADFVNTTGEINTNQNSAQHPKIVKIYKKIKKEN